MSDTSQIPSVAVTGGKGGTGKSLIATNFAVKFAHEGKRVLLIDCDVENPNTNILLGKDLQQLTGEVTPITIFTPKFDTTKCVQCKICRSGCYRHAILQFPKQYPSVLEHMCSGCETCRRLCPQDAIYAGSREIGIRYFFPESGYPNLHLLIGELHPSEAMSVEIVKNILAYSEALAQKYHYDLLIIDTAPGAHCDVEQSLVDARVIVCVTEPTPFGEHDLNRILELIRLIGQQASIILNRADMADYRAPIFALADRQNSVVIGEIPLDRMIVEDYARGQPFALDPRDFPAKQKFEAIFRKITAMIAPITAEGQP
jgi:MinD superfamily P-loop ATPase